MLNRDLNMIIFLGLFFLMLPFPSKCFGPTGHFIVARIAELELQNHKDFPQMMGVLGLLSPYTKETNHPFEEAAVWADDIKYLRWSSMNKWHFDNVYINNDNNKLRVIPKDEYLSMGLINDPSDIVQAINNAKSNLRNIRKSLVDDRMGKSINLRLLIHLIGDIHQPLHSCTLVNSQFPKGDSGGNKFIIDMPGARNLHSYWDRMLKKYSTLKTPLTESHFEKLDNMVNSIISQFSRSYGNLPKRLSTTSVRAWANESVKICLEYVYNGISPGEEPSIEYIERGKLIIDEQLAVAGYRLADTIKSIFEIDNVFGDHTKENLLKKIETDTGKILKTNKNNLNIMLIGINILFFNFFIFK